MKEIFENKIVEINALLNCYYEKERNGQFKNNEENYNENFVIKNKIKELLENVNSSNTITENVKQLLKNELLKILAENTGCVDDCKISEIIIKELIDKKAITKNDVDYYRENENTGRWK